MRTRGMKSCAWHALLLRGRGGDATLSHFSRPGAWRDCRSSHSTSKSLNINEALERKEGMAIDYGNLGNVSRTRGDLAAACAHWTRARDQFAAIGMKPQVAQVEVLMRKAGCDGA